MCVRPQKEIKIKKSELCELDMILIMQKYFENDSSFCLNIM